MGKKKDPLRDRLKALEKNHRKGGLYRTLPEKTESKGESKKKKKVSYKFLYDQSLMHFQFHLYELMCAINDIPLGIYVTTSPNGLDLIKNIKIDDEFKSYSKLDWETPYSINGLFFRGRFATLVLYKIARKTHKLIKSVIEYEASGDLSKKEIQKLRYMVLDSWMQVIDNFVKSFLSRGENYTGSLIKIAELLLLLDDRDPDIISYVTETAQVLQIPEESGIVANNVTKTAYLLATSSESFKRCPPYMEMLDIYSDEDIAEQVGGLGYAILKRRQKHDIPVLYKCFQEAIPKIYSRFWDINEDAPEITVGLKALEFSKLFYGHREQIQVGKLQ